MVSYYSQHGEDVLLDNIFKGQEDGFFVEVGCIDGIRYSNTLTFEERGWRGVCIEAHADYIDSLRKNRPGSIVEHCAAGEADEDAVTFYANFRGSLSSLDKSLEDRFKAHGKYFGGFVEQKVAKRCLNTVFAKHGVDHIDVLSLDIEGYEVEAIRGLDLQRYRPRVMVIEIDGGKAEEDALDALILPHGYLRWISLGSNAFYLADEALAVPVRNRIFQAELFRAANEVLGTPEGRNQIILDTHVANGGMVQYELISDESPAPKPNWFNRLFRRR